MPLMRQKPRWLRQGLWFIGLWAAGVVALGLVAGAIKLVI